MNLVGFRIGGHDNGTMMFDDDSCLPKCPRCHFRLNFTAHNALYRQRRKRRSDLLCTYDGAEIVTRRFRDFCTAGNYANAQCLEFRDGPGHFHLVVDEPVIEFDAERRGTRFLKFCPVCENYDEVIGANPVYLSIAQPLPDGFCRTDLEFAGGSGKHPLILVGCATRSKMLEFGLKGIIFSEAYGME